MYTKQNGMSILNLSNYLTVLSNTPDYGQLFIKARHLAEVQKHLLDIIPSQFKNRCTAGQHTADGLLVIYVDNGASATRLRNFAPSIQQKMNKTGIKVEDIRFRIQPQLHSQESEDTHEIKRLLSQTAVEHLDRLSCSLPAESPLQSSLKALLANSRHE
ncbi:conserved hypothetical protein [Nitrosomonas eutropha C91]|uniref:Uncharacterized protein DUF721 n=3 Tax=Nitrosomonas eutropha TaxID=916 RepID=A0ABX5M5N9_9PROT|nr:conserved hypothetical protein [Nitrosomonas eutropha C91]PXV79771.1 uncharacterized protein DUF721 [Nitrosomonas eutropha]